MKSGANRDLGRHTPAERAGSSAALSSNDYAVNSADHGKAQTNLVDKSGPDGHTPEERAGGSAELSSNKLRCQTCRPRKGPNSCN